MAKTNETKQKIYSLFTVIVFMALLILPTAAWGILSAADHFTPGIMDTLDYDLGENRNKASFPEEYNPDTYPAEVELYYNDRVPFRSVIISANTDFTTATENIYKESIRPTLISLFYSNEENSAGDTILVENDLANMFGNNSSDKETAPSADNLGENADGGADPDDTAGNDSETTPELPAHKYVETEHVNATCTTDGHITYTCEKCQDSYTDLLPATGHAYHTTQVVDPDYDNFGYSICVCDYCNLEIKTNYTQKLIDTTYFPPNIINQQAVEGRRNWLFYAGNNSPAYYRGQLLLDEETLADYANRVATLQALCEEKGIQLQLMILPNKEQVYSEYMPSYTINDTYKRVPRLVDYVSESTGIEILYPIDELQAGKLYWQTYYKYDTHWTYAGAFIGVQCLYQSLGLPTTSLDDFEYDLTYRDGGDLVLLAALNPDNYPDDPVYTPIYKQDVNILKTTGLRDGEGTFTAQTDSTNECNFVLIGDSYRLQMLPFLERDFTNVTLTHRNNISSEKIKKAVLEADILVLEAVERYDTRLMNNVNTLIEILTGTETTN